MSADQLGQCIVFGGDSKFDEKDVLDETLYLLNTCLRPVPILA